MANKKRAEGLRFLLIGFALCLVFSRNASAALVSIDDPVYGIGGLTLDTSTGQEWLDLTFTDGLSYQFVASQLGPGGLFEGFETVTTAEFQQLVTNGGWTFGYGVNFANDPAKYNVALSMVHLFGETFTTAEPRNLSYGFVSDTNVSGDHYYDQIFTVNSDANPFTSSVFVNVFSSSSALNSVGVWLHRPAETTAVPEPASILLLSTCLIGSSAARRRRKRCQP